MATHQIDLDAAKGFEIRGTTVYLDHGDHESFVKIPKGARVSMWKRGNKGTLNVGGLNSIACSVSGNLHNIRTLWEALTEVKG